jgi:hypothetical protein
MHVSNNHTARIYMKAATLSFRVHPSHIQYAWTLLMHSYHSGILDDQQTKTFAIHQGNPLTLATKSFGCVISHSSRHLLGIGIALRFCPGPALDFFFPPIFKNRFR